MTEMSRREFVVASALAGVGLTTGSLRAADGQVAGAPADWVDRPMRWAQLTLVENDPGRFDPQFWLDYFTRIHADAACLSADRVVAYSPTAVPLHHRSASSGAGDPSGDLAPSSG
jgi:hypothetical protein